MKGSAHHRVITDRLADLGELIRLRVLRLLETEELSVGEVAKVVQLPQSTISRHLKVLGDGGWVAKRNVGTATLYRMVLDDLQMADRALWLAVREQMGRESELAEDARRLAAVIAERRTDSQAFFGRVAGQWDSVRGELFGERFTPVALLSLLPREWTVADIGCGTGNVSELLSPFVRRVIAIDRSPEMLEAARRRLTKATNVEFAEGDLAGLPLADSSVDAAVVALVLHHVEDPARAMAELRRVLRAGGVAVVIDMLPHGRDDYRHTMGHRHLGFSRESIGAMFGGAGFSDVTYNDLPGEPDARGPGLFVSTARRLEEEGKRTGGASPGDRKPSRK